MLTFFLTIIKKVKLNDASARNLDVVCTIGYNPLLAFEFMRSRYRFNIVNLTIFQNV